MSEHLYQAKSDPYFKSIEAAIGRLRRKIGKGMIEARRGIPAAEQADALDAGTAADPAGVWLTVALLPAILVIAHCSRFRDRSF